jgi:hypothetical protein
MELEFSRYGTARYGAAELHSAAGPPDGGCCPPEGTRSALQAPRSALQMPIGPEPELRAGLPVAVTRLVLGSCLFSIRVPPKPAIVNCELCSKPFSAQGPTGYYDERPICDACLLEQENQLGMLMALAIFTREYARLVETAGDTAAAAATEMLAFARIYELFAARFGPSRPFDFSSVAAFRAIG